LLAAYAFVQAARAIGAVQLLPVLAKRIGQTRAAWQRSLGRALRLELISLAACAILVAALAAALDLLNMQEAAAMVAIIALGLPARHPGELLVAKRYRIEKWRLGSALASVVGAGVVLALGLDWRAGALVLALRDWTGLLAAILFAPRRPAKADPSILTFADAAAQTGASAWRKLSYRVLKGLLTAVLGPAGSFAARTGRGANLDQKAARFIPQSRAGLAALTAAATGASAFFLVVAREPSTLLVAAALARIAAPAGAALLWWDYARIGSAVDDEDDE
jgi:hypothetical protein